MGTWGDDQKSPANCSATEGVADFGPSTGAEMPGESESSCHSYPMPCKPLQSPRISPFPATGSGAGPCVQDLGWHEDQQASRMLEEYIDI